MSGSVAYQRVCAQLGTIYGEMVAAQEDANALRTLVATRDAEIQDLRRQLAESQGELQKGDDK